MISTEYIDTRRTWWLDRFFTTWDFDSPEDLLTAIGGMSLDLSSLARAGDLTKLGLGGALYWLLFLKGWLEYSRSGRIETSNVYYDLMTRHFDIARHDPGLVHDFSSEPGAVKRIASRFRDATYFYEATKQGLDANQSIEPIEVLIQRPAPIGAKIVFARGAPAPLRAAKIDGYHRLFLARLFGVRWLRCHLITRGVRQDVDGQVDNMRRVISSMVPIKAAVAVASSEGDALVGLPHRDVRHLMLNGSNVGTDVQGQIGDVEIAQFEALRSAGVEFLVIPKSAAQWLAHRPAIGEYLRGAFRLVVGDGSCMIFALSDRGRLCVDQVGPDGLLLPPPEMMGLAIGTYDADTFVQSGRLGVAWMRALLRRHGCDLDMQENILEFGCGAGRLLRHFRESSASRISGTDCNPFVVKWCSANLPFARCSVNGGVPPLSYDDGTFDLVYAVSVFSHLEEAWQVPWVNELSRITKPGGLMLLTLHGASRLEELRPEQVERFAAGQLVVCGGAFSGTNACAAYHPKEYVERVLSRGLEIVDFSPEEAIDVKQDIVLLQRSPTDECRAHRRA